jgi:hypothetical protein
MWKWSEVKWSEVKWSEVKWSEVKWSEVKWSEVTWRDVKLGIKATRCKHWGYSIGTQDILTALGYCGCVLGVLCEYSCNVCTPIAVSNILIVLGRFGCLLVILCENPCNVRTITVWVSICIMCTLLCIVSLCFVRLQVYYWNQLNTQMQ